MVLSSGDNVRENARNLAFQFLEANGEIRTFWLEILIPACSS